LHQDVNESMEVFQHAVQMS